MLLRKGLVKYFGPSKSLSTTLYSDNFLRTMTSIVECARWFGVAGGGGCVCKAWGSSLFGAILVVVVISILRVIRALTRQKLCSSGSVTVRVSGAIFYGNGLFSLLLLWRVASRWHDSIACHWKSVEESTFLNIPLDPKLRRNMIGATIVLVICTVVEHGLSMLSAVGPDCPPAEFLEKYTIISHGFLLHRGHYSIYIGIPVLFVSNLATCLWNFQDLVIILFSMGLASRYRRLNDFVKDYVEKINQTPDKSKSHLRMRVNVLNWRRVRRAYVCQAALVRRVDAEIGAIVLLSNLNNLYFICLQLFLGITQDSGNTINRLYYVTSLVWLCARASGVVLFAAEVQIQSKKALECIYECSVWSHNSEVVRLQRFLTKNDVALSGKHLFYLNRTALLKVASMIIAYELVLIQVDSYDALNAKTT